MSYSNSYSSVTAPCSSVSVNAYMTPDAARVLITACEELKKLGLDPTANIVFTPDPAIAAVAAQKGA